MLFDCTLRVCLGLTLELLPGSGIALLVGRAAGIEAVEAREEGGKGTSVSFAFIARPIEGRTSSSSLLKSESSVRSTTSALL